MAEKEKREKLTAKREIKMKGRPLSRGVAVARVCLFNDTIHRRPVFFNINEADVEKEKKRVKEAFARAESNTDKIKKEAEKNIGPSEAAIFSAHIMMLKDRTLRKKIFEAIENKHLNAEAAVKDIFDEYEARLSSVENKYVRERVSDISEIKKGILSSLGESTPTFNCQEQSYCVRGRNRIVVAEEMTPQFTMNMDKAKVAAFLTERGGKTSHAAILARALGIPAVSGLKGIHSLLDCGKEVAVDGEKGEVIINPSEETVSALREKEGKNFKTLSKVAPVEKVRVFANINTYQDLEEAIEMDAEGVGLYRTEFEFIVSGKILSEEEQYERYVKIIKKMGGKPVYFRALDLGSDKPAPGLKYMREENPALGLRGARLLESNLKLLKTQARALARASAEGKAHVMIPMIVSSRQFTDIKKEFFSAIEDIKESNISFGAMFEVPSACLDAREILKESHFASIGSNDLIQYLFAVDRNNDSVAYAYDPDREVFWNLLRSIADAASEWDRPISICGEIAAEPKYLEKILDSGISTVSVSPRFIPEVRSSASALK